MALLASEFMKEDESKSFFIVSKSRHTQREHLDYGPPFFLFFTLGGLGRDSLSSAKTDGRRDSPPICVLLCRQTTWKMKQKILFCLISFFDEGIFLVFFHLAEKTRDSRALSVTILLLLLVSL